MENALASSDFMWENLGNLSSKNKAYARELDNLHRLSDPIALEARSLGYVASDEVVVRMPVAQLGSVATANPGGLVVYKKNPVLKDADIKYIAIATTIIISLTALGLNFYRSWKLRSVHRASLAQDASRT